MHIPILLLTTSLGALVSAELAFTMSGPYSVVAGVPFDITWASTTGPDTVSIFLRKGDASDLETVGMIASSLANTNSYTWTPSPSLPQGSDYAFEILSDTQADVNNYSAFFTLTSATSASSPASSSTVTGSMVIASSLTSTVVVSVAGSNATSSSSVSSISSSAPSGSSMPVFANASITSTASSAAASSAAASSVLLSGATSTKTEIQTAENGISEPTSAGGHEVTATVTSMGLSSSPTGNAGVVVDFRAELVGGAVLGWMVLAGSWFV